ncbi:MAG: AI-2E family transporter [Burkholderiaceae bacterium]|nr:AI-2E family transporter [Burkholderiaceae bacterium]
MNSELGGRADHYSGPFVWCCVLAATCMLLFLLNVMLWLALPFLLAVVLYYLLVPPMSRLVLAGFHRETAAAIVAGGVLFTVALAAFLCSPWILSNMGSWQELLGRYLEGGATFVRNTAVMLEQKSSFLRNAHLNDAVNNQLAAYTEKFEQKHVAGLLISLASWLPSLVLAPFLAFFFLRDGRRFKKFLGRAVPNAFFERTLYLLHEVDQTAHRYFQGLFRLTVIDTLVLGGGLWMIGVSSALVLGLIAAVLAWVPAVGSVLGCLIVILVVSTDAPSQPLLAYGAIGVFIVARLLDDFIFMPLTLGRSLHIHPLLTVLMIFIGGVIAGVTGLMLALPLLGVVMVVGETIGEVVTDPRLRARHRHALALRDRLASEDLI